MNRDSKLDELFGKLKAGTMTYDDTADFFMLSVVGLSTGISRDELLTKLRAHFQDTIALNSYLGSLSDRFEALVDKS
jgi:hypothetical protein